MQILQYILIGISVPFIILLIIDARKRAKALADRIEQYKQEEEAAKSQPGPINPYKDFTTLK